MISATHLDGSPFLLNMDLIVAIERTPDTMLSLTTGDTVLVRESPEEIVDRIVRFKCRLARGAAELVTARSVPDEQ